MQQPNKVQVDQFIRILLGTTGPVGAWLISKYGFTDSDLNLIVSLVTLIAFPAASLVWGWIAGRDESLIAATASIKGVDKVEVDTRTASPSALKAVADPKLENVEGKS